MSTDSDLLSLSGDPEMVARARRALAVAFDGDAVKITNGLIDYQGTYPDLRTYVVMELEEHLPPYMIWLLHQFVDVDAVMKHWISSGRNWTLPDDGRNGGGGVHVFLASRPTSTLE